jgi:hypothetical protein
VQSDAFGREVTETVEIEVGSSGKMTMQRFRYITAICLPALAPPATTSLVMPRQVRIAERYRRLS